MLPVGQFWAQNTITDPLYQAAERDFNLGQHYYEQGDYHQSLRALEEAQRQFEAGQYTIQWVLTQSNLAQVYDALGQWEQAEAAIATSLANPAIENYPRIKARTLDIQAKFRYQQGNYPQALKLWKTAEPLYRQAGDGVDQLTNKINQAYAHLSLGQNSDYDEFRTQLLAELKNPTVFLSQFSGEVNQNLITDKVSHFLSTIGKYKTALQLLESQIAKYPNNLNYQFQRAEILQYQGNQQLYSSTYFSNQYSPWQCPNPDSDEVKRAQQNGKYRDAIAQYEVIKDANPDPLLKAKTQIALLKLWKNVDRQQAEQIVPEISLAALANSSELVALEIDYAKALGCIAPSQVLGLLNQAYSHAKNLKDSSIALGTLGSYLLAQKATDKAKEYTELALVNAQQLNLAYLGYQWLWQLGKIDHKVRDNKAALNHYESSTLALEKARHDFVHLSQNIQFSFLQDIRPLYLEYLELLLANGNTDENIKRAEELVSDLQLAEVEDFLRCQSIGLIRLTDSLHPNATIIYPILLGDRLELIAELPTGETLKQFNKSEKCDRINNQTIHCTESISSSVNFQDELNEFSWGITDPDVGAARLKELSQEIYNHLLRPLAHHLPEQGTLVFVVDSYLQKLPFAALHDGEKYLIEKYSLATSIGSQLSRDTSTSLSKANVLLTGISSAPNWDEKNLKPLPGVAGEIRSLLEVLPNSNVLQDEQLNHQQLQEALEYNGPDIVHVATHGTFGQDSDNTRLHLWTDDLRVDDFARLLRLGADRNPNPLALLVLSACETAKGDNRATLGIAGMAIRTNAASTVASLWKVSDRSTADLMKEFYQSLLQNNHSRAEALRQAQLSLLHEQVEDYSEVEPYYWAAFILVGNWT
ncbi:MAG: CHAT domain-containing protein [Spirulina sp. SIO3F2]|nr:CHAT domain-containing protein [Spirulina sp. SIO3F2]